MPTKTSTKPRRALTNRAALTDPITITVSGNMAASLRFIAHLGGTTPEEEAKDSIAQMLTCSLLEGMNFAGEEDTRQWLGGPIA